MTPWMGSPFFRGEVMGKAKTLSPSFHPQDDNGIATTVWKTSVPAFFSSHPQAVG